MWSQLTPSAVYPLPPPTQSCQYLKNAPTCKNVSQCKQSLRDLFDGAALEIPVCYTFNEEKYQLWDTFMMNTGKSPYKWLSTEKLILGPAEPY